MGEQVRAKVSDGVLHIRGTIGSRVVRIEAKLSELYGNTRQMIQDLISRAVGQIDLYVNTIRSTASTKLLSIQDGAKGLVADPKAKATMGGAAGGAVAGGAS